MSLTAEQQAKIRQESKVSLPERLWHVAGGAVGGSILGAALQVAINALVLNPITNLPELLDYTLNDIQPGLEIGALFGSVLGLQSGAHAKEKRAFQKTALQNAGLSEAKAEKVLATIGDIEAVAERARNGAAMASPARGA